MALQLPDQSRYTGFIPKDMYDSYVANQAAYAGKPTPYHYYQYYGIPYKVSYANPYQLIDYVDTATALPIPGMTLPGAPGVTIIVPSVITPPSPNMQLPGQGIPDPAKIITPQPVITTPTPVTSYTPVSNREASAGGTSGFGSVQAWAMAGIALAMAATWGATRKRKRKARV